MITDYKIIHSILVRNGDCTYYYDQAKCVVDSQLIEKLWYTGRSLFQLFVTVWPDIDNNKKPKIKKLSTLKVPKNNL